MWNKLSSCFVVFYGYNRIRDAVWNKELYLTHGSGGWRFKIEGAPSVWLLMAMASLEVVWVTTWLDSCNWSFITTCSCENSIVSRTPLLHQEHNASHLTEFYQALVLSLRSDRSLRSRAATSKIKLPVLRSPGDALESYPNYSNTGAVFAEWINEHTLCSFCLPLSLAVST